MALRRKVSMCLIWIAVAVLFSACSGQAEQDFLNSSDQTERNTSTAVATHITAEDATHITTGNATTTESSFHNTNNEKTTTTMTGSITTTTIHVDGPASVMSFSTLEEYKNRLLSMSNSNALSQAFLNASEYGAYSFDESNFEMLLNDHYFLLPLLPAGSSLQKAEFLGNGTTEFTATFFGKNSIYFVCRHNKQVLGEIENAARTTFVNSRGLTIYHDHVRDAGASYGFYTWQEDGYYCRMSYEGDPLDAYDQFVKNLSFERISLK